MSILLLCPACEGKMKVPDRLVGRKARCPRCGSIIDVDAEAAPHGPKDDYDDEPAPPAKRRSRDANDDEAEPDPAPRRRRREEGIQERPADRGPRDEPADGREEEDEPRPVKRRKKKRRRPRLQQQEEETDGFVLPDWAWWAMAGGGAFAFIMGVAATLLIAGPTSVLGGIALTMAVMMPVSIVVLILSMFISSALSGGIDFGEPQVAIVKAGILLFVVNLISLIPFVGIWLALPVWFLGLVYLFGLDIWEARFLIGINWILNLLINIFLIAGLHSALSGSSTKMNRELHDDGPPRQGQPVDVWNRDDDD